MVLLEAMGAGLAAIASAVGGVPDVIHQPNEGWLVAPEAPAALAAAIQDSLDNATMREERGAAGASRISAAYGFDSWISRHEEVYRSALEIRQGA